MSRCNWLALETLESRSIMPKTSLQHMLGPWMASRQLDMTTFPTHIDHQQIATRSSQHAHFWSLGVTCITFLSKLTLYQKFWDL